LQVSFASELACYAIGTLFGISSNRREIGQIMYRTIRTQERLRYAEHTQDHHLVRAL
jgi:hypothetical protein